MRRAPWLSGLLAVGCSAFVACDSPGDRAASQDASADVATTADTQGDATDTADTTGANESAVCTRWRSDHPVRAEGEWTGSADACEPGDFLEPGPTNTLRQVNLYRWLAGLPDVRLAADKSEAAQACALIMHANRDIEHAVPANWKCVSAAGKGAAALSNLATTGAVESIDLYMTDQDVASLGHRRWLLSNTLGPIGVGSTSSFSCLHVLGGDGDARARWVSWPPAGDVPYQAMHIESWMDVDLAGWSIQSDYIDLRRGDVSVTRNGTTVAVDVWELDPGYGSSFGLGIRPRGWKTAIGDSYVVDIAGLSEGISWQFDVVDCD